MRLPDAANTPQVTGIWFPGTRIQTLTLGETLEFLFRCHRAAPFLFFNGNTFGEIARRIVDAVFLKPQAALSPDGLSVALRKRGKILTNPHRGSNAFVTS